MSRKQGDSITSSFITVGNMRKIKVYNDAVVLLLIALHYTYKNSTENKKKIKEKSEGTKGDDGIVNSYNSYSRKD